MSDPFEKQPAPFPLPGIISILVALLAIFAEQFEPLQSSRPGVPEEVKQLSQPLESIDARLWQDPFAVISDYTNVSPADKHQESHDIKALTGNIVQHQPKSASKPVIVLGVMVFGGDYAELTEFRLRTRYAVLSGLAAANYVPEDAEHISFINTAPHRALPKLIPFEWFVNKQGSQDESPVLLLWLNESDFMGEPLQSLQKLVDYIAEPVNAGHDHSLESVLTEPSIKRLKFKFIGPTSSTLLIKMVGERTSPGFDEKIIKEPLDLYIASATADEKALLQHAASQPSPQDKKTKLEGICDDTLAKCFKSINGEKTLVNLTRVIAEDGELIKSILDELKLRGVDPIDDHAVHPLRDHFLSKSHIALISEWDTFYGRSLPDAMIHRINDQTHGNHAPEWSTCASKPDNLKQPSWLHLYSYMRGLDGMVPGMVNSKQNKLKAQQKNGEDKKYAPSERPEGQSQQDYLRRLAQRIEETNNCLNRNNEGEIRAFGILGSDVYDKLMVLKALKPKFPRALFFTTDLDARLIHPEEYETTRNLIVASSFGFQLHPNLQDKIPPLRDSYSTAYFLSTQISLHNALNSEQLKQQDIDNMRKPPRIFELGFQQVFDFAPVDIAPCPSLEHCKNLHPAGYTAGSGRNRVITLFLAFGFAALIAVLLNKGGATWMNRWLPKTACKQATSSVRYKGLSNFALVLVLLIPAVGLVVVAMETHPGYQGEPFSWVAGVSLWPSIIIRFVACILCWIFVFKVMRDIPAIQTQLAGRFHLQEQSQPVVNVVGLKRLQKPWQARLDRDADTVEKLWRSYRWATNPSFLKNRAMQSLLIYLAFGMCLVFAFGTPLVPFRGPVSLIVNWVVLVPTIIGFIYLIMLNVDATRYCIKFIHILDNERITWPENTLNYFGFEGANPFVNQNINSSSEVCKMRQILAKNYRLEHWIGIQFITDLTKGIGNLIYYPFIVLALLVFALSPIFDNWHIPVGLALVFIFSALLTLVCGLLLRRAAEHARNRVLKSLTVTLMAVRGCEEKPAKMIENQLTMAIDQIKSIREGAFLPLTHEPAIQALLLPLGGWGGFTLLENIILRGG